MDQHFIHNPHDRFFKEAFSHIEVVRSFVETYLQPRIGFRINLDELQLFQNDSVDSSLKEAFSDIIYKTEIIPEKISIFLLFEHKSFPDPQIGMQIGNYMNMLRENMFKSHSGNILYIIPIIIYNGERKWNLIFEKELNSAFKFAWNINYLFFDISHMSDNQISRGSALLRIVFLAMKYAHTDQILNKLDEFSVLFKELMNKESISIYLNTFSHYVESVAPPELRKLLVEKIRSWEGRMDMPEVSQLFQMLKSEGREEGMKEGIKKGIEEGKIKGKNEGKIEGKIEDAQRMLQKGMSKELIQEITGLPAEKIDELKNK
jgi:predicted transposase/invertase (TIGR01784 family)